MHLVKTLEARKDSLLEALPAHVGKDRFFRVLLGTIRTNPKLMQCAPESVLNAVLESARLGLEIGGNLNQCFLIPYGPECKLLIGYGGMISLAKNSGDVAAVTCELVRQHDHFERASESIIHNWNPWDGEDKRGPVVGAYCILTLTNHEKQYETMSVDEIEAIRARSRAAHNGPWVSDWGEMAKKTVLRRALKKVRLSPEAQDAISQDDDAHFVQSRVVRQEVGLGNRAVLDLVRGASDDGPVAEDPADSGGDLGGGDDRDSSGGAADPEEGPSPAKRAARSSGAKRKPAKTADELEFEGNAKSEPEDDNPF